jgi:hypothetical protein
LSTQHFPRMHESSQQLPLPEQLEPSEKQHFPPTQLSLQQSLFTLQPTKLFASQHTPPLPQFPPQHWPPVVQEPPLFLQQSWLEPEHVV